MVRSVLIIVLNSQIIKNNTPFKQKYFILCKFLILNQASPGKTYILYNIKYIQYILNLNYITFCCNIHKSMKVLACLQQSCCGRMIKLSLIFVESRFCRTPNH